MRGMSFRAVAAFIVLLGTSLPAQVPSTRPALVVVVSVDQLATWVFDEVRPLLPATGGFHRLLAHGVRFTECAYQHGCTETGPGHATIGTGATAAMHGIVGNHWIDADGKNVYCATSPGARAVGGGDDGFGPGRLCVPTFGDALKAQVPGSRVVSISMKDRSAILMGGATADLALWFDHRSGRFVTSTAFTSTLPAWLERFEETYGAHRYFGCRWDRCGPPDAYAGLVDDRPFEGPDPNGRRTLPERIDGGLAAPGAAFHSHLYTSPFGNQIVVDLARTVLVEEDLGADDVPDLLCVGFSSTDAVGHRNGPDSVEARDTLLRVDTQLDELLRALDAHVGRGRYAVLLSADHGVAPVPEERVAAGLPGGRASRQGMMVRNAAEKAMRDAFGAPPEGHRRFVRGSSGGFLHLDQGALTAAGVDRTKAAAAVAASLTGISGLRRALPITDLESVPEELRAIHGATMHDGRVGDVWLIDEPFWLGSPRPAASHGTVWEYDREVPLLAYGAGLRKGIELATPVTPGTIAVIAAALCGIEPPSGATDPLPRVALIDGLGPATAGTDR